MRAALPTGASLWPCCSVSSGERTRCARSVAASRVAGARQQALAPDTILVFDRGSLDFAWLARLTETGVFFITRLKDGTAYDVMERHAVPTQGGVVVDE